MISQQQVGELDGSATEDTSGTGSDSLYKGPAGEGGIEDSRTDTPGARTPTSPKEKRIPIVEVFGPTIQGEGLVVGQRTLFIRFGLCDYRCSACDSMHAVDPMAVKRNARWMTQTELFPEVVELAHRNNCGWVTLSGGNPCIHDLGDLCMTLHSHDIGIAVETQGTFCPEWLRLCDYVTVSPKSPGMGERFEHQKYLDFIATLETHPGLSCKVVIFSAQDLEFASLIAEMSPRLVGSDRFYLSLGNPYPPTVDGKNISGLSSQAELFESIERYKELIVDLREYKALRHARFLPQLHVWLWGHEKGR